MGVAKRLQDDGRWYSGVREEKDKLIKLARSQGMTRDAAQEWAYSTLDDLYPAVAAPELSESPASDSGQVRGLGDIPGEWGQLPLNASLQSELSWVQSNRLSIVEETPGGATVVHLDRAREPAPSMAALGWLETSIRSYAKYVDVVARCLASAVDEAEHVARERVAMGDVRALLAEMRDAV